MAKELSLAASGLSDSYHCGLPMNYNDILDRKCYPGKKVVKSN